MYVAAAFHQLEVAVASLSQMFACMEESLLAERPFEKKRSIRELASHISIVMQADLEIMNGSSAEEMDQFYRLKEENTLEGMQKALSEGVERLTAVYRSFSEKELAEPMASYWGVSYTRYEWLLEIVAHLYHHRAQLHVMLTAMDVEMDVPLFE